MPSPEVALPGPFDTPPSPDLPVAARWLLTSVETAECEQGVLYGRGPAQVRFSSYPPLIASPFLLEVYLVPSHCGSRAPLGGYKRKVASFPRLLAAVGLGWHRTATLWRERQRLAN